MSQSSPYLPPPASASPARSQMHAEMNVTPMLDVLLVLLIIFMAAISARMTIEAHLPDPHVQATTDAVPIVLEVGPRGYYAVNRQPVPPDSIAARLYALYATRPDKRIILKGARNASYQQIITAMGIARGAGVTVIGVETRDTPVSRPPVP